MTRINETDHRPWPLPSSPWVMKQSWSNVLFAHWPIAIESIRPIVPKSLDIDTYEGQTWLGIIPFHMHRIRVRGLPPIPMARAFPEINVRVYVRANGKSGVYFFSLDAAHRLAVRAARLFHLPYFYANIRIENEAENIRFMSERQGRRGLPASFQAIYRPSSKPFQAKKGTLEHWLTERYCLYTTDKSGQLIQGDIHHKPWSLQHAQATIQQLNMVDAIGLELPDTSPLLHYSEGVDVLAWLPRRL